MELAPVPHPPPALSRGRVVGALLVLAPLVVLVLLPTVLGLQRYVVADDAMRGDQDGSVGRGAVALTRSTPAGDLVVGDVISFRPPADDVPGSVTRRIVAIEDGVARTRGDGLPVVDPWRLELDEAAYSRVVFTVPLIGVPFAGDAGQGGWVLLSTVPALVLVLLLVGSWRRAHRGVAQA